MTTCASAAVDTALPSDRQSTVSRFPFPRLDQDGRDTALGSTARDWEADINDMTCAAGVASSMIEDALAIIPEGFNYHHITVQQAELLIFSVYEVQRRVRDFYEGYHAALNGAA